MFDSRVKHVYETMSPSQMQKSAMLDQLYSKMQPRPALIVASAHRIKRVVFAPLTVILIIVLSATALAAAIWVGTIDWNGNAKQDNLPSPTAAPVKQIEESGQKEIAMQLLAARTEGELWIVRYSDSEGNWYAASAQCIKNISSIEALASDLNESGVAYRLPAKLPDGYTFQQAWVAYECKPDYHYTLINKETTPDGLIVERYETPPEANLICAYMLLYQNTDGAVLRINADLACSEDDTGFGVTENVAYKTLALAGFDDAVAVTRPTDSTLYLRQTLPVCLAYWQATPALPAQAGIDEEAGWFDEIHYSIFATQLGVDALITVLSD
ncbi:MAG TPA: hypothetical protein VN417_07265 [Candidatus Cryosericum sp.]|nr:hypothetical protein [Candidatus Cryosericum sp.]